MMTLTKIKSEIRNRLYECFDEFEWGVLVDHENHNSETIKDEDDILMELIDDYMDSIKRTGQVEKYITEAVNELFEELNDTLKRNT